ncbi:MAG: ABC transporter permease [Bacteroidales bacterium]|nr:ABC transporter permease [Bacteroidales bacterium]
MSKIGLVIKHEYIQRVAKKSFLILTLLMPILFLALIFVPMGLSQLDDNKTEHIAIVDNTHKYASLFESNEEFCFESADIDNANLIEASKNNNYDAIIVINDDLIDSEKEIYVYSDHFINHHLEQTIKSTLSDYVEQERIDSYNIPDLKEIMDKTNAALNIHVVKWNDDGEEENASTEIAIIVGLVFSMLMYMFVFVYGAQVMNSVTQEKTSRIVEVLVCSVKPFELMMGKIISMALVGLTQIAIWVVLTGGLFAIVSPMLNTSPETAATATEMIAQGVGTQQLDTTETTNMMQEITDGLMSANIVQIIICFIIYFIGGYLLYSCLFAAIGSAVDSETDTQQFTVPIMIPVIFAMYAAIYSIENPDGPLALWCSMIPFTSPMVMMVRLPYGVPMWQLFVSIALLTITFIGTVWLSAKIYRTGILMYGKKIGWRDLYRWIKY